MSVRDHLDSASAIRKAGDEALALARQAASVLGGSMVCEKRPRPRSKVSTTH